MYAGDYPFTVTDALGCTLSDTVTITEPDELIIDSIIAQDVSCNSFNDGSISTSASGGTFPYGYSWSGPNGFYSPFQNASNLLAGNYSLYLYDVNGCSVQSDSILILEPALLEANVSVTSLACNSDTNGVINITPLGGVSPYTFLWSNGSISQNQVNLSAGIYSVIITDSNACDLSISNIEVTEPLASVSSSSITACDSLTWNGQTIDTSGVYTDTLTNINGCDSVLTLVATITTADSVTSSITACDTYDWNGQIIDSSGSYIQTFTNVNACDSVHTLVATITTADSVTSSITACDSYDWNGQIIDSSGSYIQTFTNINGCDSVHTLVATITTADSVTSSITACDSLTWNGTIYTTSGVYTFATTNVNGCDSVLTLDLTINPVTNETNVITACDSYDWNGTTYSTSGVYTFATTNVNGCDSVHTLDLTISTIDSVIYNVDNASCYGDFDGQISVLASGGVAPYVVDWSFWTGQTIFNLYAGDYPFTVTDALGCTLSDTVTITEPDELIIDSIIAQDVSCNSFNDGSISTSASGGTFPYGYSWSGPNGFYSPFQNASNLLAGNYSLYLYDVNGCSVQSDSILILEPALLEANVSVTSLACNSDTNGVINITPLGGVSPYTFLWSNGSISQNQVNLSAGIYSVIITDSNACDLSISNIEVTEPLASVSSSSITACDSLTWNGQTIDTSGVYTDTLTNINGCDSVLTLVATITTADSVTSSITACDTYDWNGQIIDSSGSYIQTFTNINGCDSVHTLVITIASENFVTSNITACVPFNWNGQTLIHGYTQTSQY